MKMTRGIKWQQFKRELTDLINRHSLENNSNTPDFLLSDYLIGCLEVFNKVVVERERWYGRIEQPQNIAGRGE